MSKIAEGTGASANVPSDIRGGDPNKSETLPLGTVLRRMRGERTLRDIERDTGIANSRLSNIERGNQQPGLKFLGRMADYYHTSVAEIIRQAEFLRDCQANPHRLMAADVERSYRFVIEDPRLQPWEEPEEVLTIEAKRQVVRMYELLTGRLILGTTTGVP